MDMNETWKSHFFENQNWQYFDARVVIKKNLDDLFNADQ